MSAYVDLRPGGREVSKRTLQLADSALQVGDLVGDGTDALFWRDDSASWLHIDGGPTHFVVTYANQDGPPFFHPVPRHPGTRPISLRLAGSNTAIDWAADEVVTNEEAQLAISEFVRGGGKTPLLEWRVDANA
jgi:hypothetical protein